MTNRRQFIQNGLALSAASFAVPGGVQADVPGFEPVDAVAELFIFDDRYSEAIRAAEVAAASQVPTASTTRLATALWYDELDLRWQESPMTLAGMTTEHGLFVVETLAIDRGMRVLSREACETEGLISWVIAPKRKHDSV